MLILLPPSEGKTAPADGPTLDLEALSFPRLHRVRDQVSRALVRLAATRRAAEVLGLGPTQADASGLAGADIGGLLDEAADGGLLVDLRSGAYVNLGKPSADLAPRTATVRVLHEQDGRRTVVSHFNKATKGRLVRALLVEGAQPTSVDELVVAWRDLGWTVEQDGTRLDVVTTGAH